MVEEKIENVETNTVEENNDVSANVETQPRIETMTPAMQKILAEMETLKANQAVTSEKVGKLDKIKNVLDGDVETESEEKFFADLTTKPKETIERKIKSEVDRIVSPIVSEREREKLVTADQQAFGLLARDPDFSETWKNVNAWVSEEEMSEVSNSPKRVEIIYGLAKSRKDRANIDKNKSLTEAERTAKNEANKTAVSERPINSGGTSQEESPQDERLKELSQARDTFDTNRAHKIGTDMLFELTQWGKRKFRH